MTGDRPVTRHLPLQSYLAPTNRDPELALTQILATTYTIMVVFSREA